jgi:hypothetical protein
MNNKTEQQLAIKEMLDNTKWDILVTLTFPWSAKKKTSDDITPTINAYFRHVETKCFGRKAKSNSILRFPVLEYSTSEGSHLHILMTKPSNKSHDEFKKILREKWKRMIGTGKQNFSKKNEWYKPIINTDEDREKVSYYISKDITEKYDTALFHCSVMNKTISI